MINIKKASGEIEPFSEEKVLNSIKRASIPQNLQNYVLKHVKSILYNNISTSEIYQHIIEFLSKSDFPYAAAKYSLKQSIMNLGPSGYPFEDFVSAILKAENYQTSVRKIVKGSAVSHEIDIIAEKESQKAMIECKFHNNPGTKTDIHVALYTKARFDDVKDLNNFQSAWLITNTKISGEAIDYSLYYRLKTISWDYPMGESLRDLINKNGLSPITSLTLLSQSQKRTLLDNHFVLSKDLLKNPNSLDVLNLPAEKKKQVLEEAEFISGNFG